MKKIVVFLMLVGVLGVSSIQAQVAKKSYNSLPELMEGATWLLRNCHTMTEEQYCSYFSEVYRIIAIRNQGATQDDMLYAQDYTDYLHSDYYRIHETTISNDYYQYGMPLSTLSIGALVDPNGIFSEYVGDVYMFRGRHYMNNPAYTVDIIYMYYQNKYYLFRIYKAFH